MAKSRYNDTEIIDDKSYATFSLPVYSRGLRTLDLLEGIQTRDYLMKVGDRLDHLAARYYGEDEYWWVIALVNGVLYPLASVKLEPGKIIKIPLNVQDVFQKLFR